jgi:hypothetical protein
MIRVCANERSMYQKGMKNTDNPGLAQLGVNILTNMIMMDDALSERTGLTGMSPREFCQNESP